jgi:hypothetical protein
LLCSFKRENLNARLVYKYYKGRIEEMKIFRLRNLLLASSALALMMLFGCSSSEESSSDSGSSEDYNQDCKDACMIAPPQSQEECLIACEA